VGFSLGKQVPRWRFSERVYFGRGRATHKKKASFTLKGSACLQFSRRGEDRGGEGVLHLLDRLFLRGGQLDHGRLLKDGEIIPERSAPEGLVRVEDSLFF